jgi:hypothetical protein
MAEANQVNGLTTDDVVAALLDIGRALDRAQKRVSRADAAPPPPDGVVHPGHRYTQKVSWDEVLSPHGWEQVRTVNGVTYWRRPGKDKGQSATTGFCKGELNGDLLFVFSTNAAPFESGVTYSKFAAYAILNHEGDWRKAARKLADEGYGDGGNTSQATFNPPPSPSTAKEGGAGSGSDAEFWSHDALLGAKFSAVRYIVHELIADESVTILGGVQKAGKSWLALQIAQCVAIGQNLFGRAVESGDVIYLALEDGARRLQDRLLKQKSSAGLPILWYTKFPKLDSKEGWPLLCDLASRRPRLLIIDTLAAAKSGKTDEADSGPMADLFNGLRELAQRHQIGILVVHHHGKTVSGDPAHDLRGSSAIGAAADVLLGLYRIRRKSDGETTCDYTNHDPENEGTPDFYLKARGRDIEDTTMRVRFGAKADWLWKEVENENDGRKMRADFSADSIVKALANRPMPVADIVEETGLSDSTVRKRLAELRGAGVVDYRDPNPGEGKAYVYYLVENDLSK